MFIFQIKELFQVNNGLATSLLSFFLSFFLNAKNLGRSDDARRRKERGWPCLRIVFSANVINERTHNNRQRNYFAKNVYFKTHKLILKKQAIRATQTWLVDPFNEQVRSTEHVAKTIQHKSQMRALRPISKCIKRLR